MFADHAHEQFNQFDCNLIDTVVVITVAREFSLDLKINSNTVLVTNRFHFGIFNGTQGVSRNGKSCDTASHCAQNITVMQRHFNPFIAIFIMHIVNDVERIHIELS
ncbi:hypothetical protein D3C81_1293550 [compost metagenome]